MAACEKKKIGTAQLTFEGQSIDLDVWEGTLGERAVEISDLRKKTGLITYDPGFMNTGSCESNITFVDGDKGILRYRGYDIEDLANNCTFVEVAYLLIHGRLPTRTDLQKFSNLLNQHSMIHEDMQIFFRNYPERAHPMAIASAMGVSLSSFYPELEDVEEEKNIAATRMLSKLRTMAALSYKKFIGKPFRQNRWNGMLAYRRTG